MLALHLFEVLKEKNEDGSFMEIVADNAVAHLQSLTNEHLRRQLRLQRRYRGNDLDTSRKTPVSRWSSMPAAATAVNVGGVVDTDAEQVVVVSQDEKSAVLSPRNAPALKMNGISGCGSASPIKKPIRRQSGEDDDTVQAVLALVGSKSFEFDLEMCPPPGKPMRKQSQDMSIFNEATKESQAGVSFSSADVPNMVPHELPLKQPARKQSDAGDFEKDCKSACGSLMLHQQLTALALVNKSHACRNRALSSTGCDMTVSSDFVSDGRLASSMNKATVPGDSIGSTCATLKQPMRRQSVETFDTGKLIGQILGELDYMDSSSSSASEDLDFVTKEKNYCSEMYDDDQDDGNSTSSTSSSGSTLQERLDVFALDDDESSDEEDDDGGDHPDESYDDEEDDSTTLNLDDDFLDTFSACTLDEYLQKTSLDRQGSHGSYGRSSFAKNGSNPSADYLQVTSLDRQESHGSFASYGLSSKSRNVGSSSSPAYSIPYL